MFGSSALRYLTDATRPAHIDANLSFPHETRMQPDQLRPRGRKSLKRRVRPSTEKRPNWRELRLKCVQTTR